jgi:hypothetical protein
MSSLTTSFSLTNRLPNRSRSMTKRTTNYSCWTVRPAQHPEHRHWISNLYRTIRLKNFLSTQTATRNWHTTAWTKSTWEM